MQSESFSLAFVLAPVESAQCVCTQWEAADNLFTLEIINQAPQKDWSMGLRERNLLSVCLCDRGSKFSPPRGKGDPTNSVMMTKTIQLCLRNSTQHSDARSTVTVVVPVLADP